MNSHWQLTKLSQLLRPALRPSRNDPVTEYRMLGVRLDGQGAFHRETQLGSQLSASTVYQVRMGDFIYSRLFAWRGAFDVIPRELDGCFVSNEFPIFQVDSSIADAEFLRRWLLLPDTLRTIEADCTGSTPLTRNRFKEDFFLALQIPLPPLPEQQRIVARIVELAKKIEEANTIRASLQVRSMDLTEAQLREGYEELSKEFGAVSLGSLLVEACYGTSEKCSTERSINAIPVLRIPNVASEVINLSNLKFASLSDQEENKLHLEAGDLLVVRTNGSKELVGRSAVVPVLNEPFAFASYLIRVRVNPIQIDSLFLQRMLQFLRISGKLVDFARTTAGQYNVSLGRIKSAEIPLPPLNVQSKFVHFTTDLESRQELLNKSYRQQIYELDALLPAILDRAFKGEL